MGISLDPRSGLRNLGNAAGDFAGTVLEFPGAVIEGAEDLGRAVTSGRTYKDAGRFATGNVSKADELEMQRLDDTMRRIRDVADYRRRVAAARAIRLGLTAASPDAAGIGGEAIGKVGREEQQGLQGSGLFKNTGLFRSNPLFGDSA